MSKAPDGPGVPVRPFEPPTPLVIGIVGGVAAGKSTVADMFARRGLRHIDADAHARAAARDPAALAEIERQIGARFVRDGALDRPALAAHVFADPAAKARLEAILHPRVRARIEAELAEARSAGVSTLLDVPLLFEAGLFEVCDTVVFVDADDDVRRARAATRGWADDELARRERNQLPIAEKRRRADHVIDNSGPLENTESAVATLLGRLETPGTGRTR